MEDADSLGVSDDDENEEETDESMEGFLVDDDYNSEEDMDLVPKTKNPNKHSIQPKVYDFIL